MVFNITLSKKQKPREVFPKHKEMKPKNYKIMGGFNGKKEKEKKKRNKKT
jgi:hypothetical protein